MNVAGVRVFYDRLSCVLWEAERAGGHVKDNTPQNTNKCVHEGQLNVILNSIAFQHNLKRINISLGKIRVAERRQCQHVKEKEKKCISCDMWIQTTLLVPPLLKETF